MMKKTNWAGWDAKKVKDSACGHLNPHVDSVSHETKPKTHAQKLLKKASENNPTKRKLKKEIRLWCLANNLQLEQEKAFHPTRKWKFDFFIDALRLAIEYEGLMSDVSRHTNVVGYSADTEKYNAAAAMGYTVLRFTPLTAKNILTELNNFKSNFDGKRI